ncbi:MAG: hypothetical protein AB7F21_00535 [Desulfuromonadales bacterium]
MESTTMMIGSTIKARCTKCRKNTDHTLISLAGDTPDDVQCASCKRTHKYRAPTVTKKAITLQQNDRQEWESLNTRLDHSQATEYSMTAAYKPKTQINHPRFGLGFVMRVAGTQKIEVLFEDGRKMMRCK